MTNFKKAHIIDAAILNSLVRGEVPYYEVEEGVLNDLEKILDVFELFYEISSLCERGYIKLSRDPDDVLMVDVTKKGLQYLEALNGMATRSREREPVEN